MEGTNTAVAPTLPGVVRPARVSLGDQIKCIQREIGMRETVYPRLVNNGKMSQKAADKELAAMKAVLETLRWLKG